MERLNIAGGPAAGHARAAPGRGKRCLDEVVAAVFWKNSGEVNSESINVPEAVKPK